MDVHARVLILNHEDLVMDRSKTVRYGRQIACRNTRAHLPGEAAGASLKRARPVLPKRRPPNISPVKQPGPH
jgi:hypothetical protein